MHELETLIPFHPIVCLFRLLHKEQKLLDQDFMLDFPGEKSGPL